MAKTLKDLNAERIQLAQQASAILDKATAENRDLTAEEEKAFNDLDKRLDANKTQIEATQRDLDRRAKLAQIDEEAARSNGRTVPDEQIRRSVVTNQRDNVQDDPCRGFKSPREFLGTVIEAGRGRRMDQRLERLMTVGSDEARGNSDPAGGFLIPEGFSPNLLKIMPEADPMGGLTTLVPMQTPSLKIPARVDTTHTTSVSGGLTVTRRPETVAGTASSMTFSAVDLVSHSLFGLSYATEEMLADSPMSFAAILAAGFSEQFTNHLVKERLTGSGVGEFQGVIGAACTVSVSKETGQAAATITKENIDKMRSRCWGYGRAVWLYNHDCLPQLRSLVQTVGTGGAPVGYFAIDANGNATLDGRPAIASEHCKTLGTVGDIVLGNWAEYLEGIYEPMQNAESIHVRFVNHERAFKFWIRNAGLPWWKAALTPAQSTATLSPFVTLQTRA